MVAVRSRAGALALVSNPSLTSAFTYTHNYTKEQDMDYSGSRLIYATDMVRMFFDWTLEGFGAPVSGDDMARLKAGDRA